MAALNWYDADQKNFRNFLSWRDKKVGQLDLFKQKLIEYAEDITSLEVDAIEAALLNVLLILATGEIVVCSRRCYHGSYQEVIAGMPTMPLITGFFSWCKKRKLYHYL